MYRIKTAFVTFFPVVPNNMGSSEVVTSRFKFWPGAKRLFQISHLSTKNPKNIQSINISKEKPFYKILKLPILINEILKYFKDAKNKILIIEGASWIFYSFIILIFTKLFIKNCKILYISHSIESEIRKKYSNIFLYYLTSILEKQVFKLSNISTSVSNKEKFKIKKLYDADTILFPNGVDVKLKRKKKYQKDKFIIYSGSYSYKPNKEAIDFLNEKIMPKLIKKYPTIKLIITGGGFNKNFSWINYKGVISKNSLYNLYSNSICMCVPLRFGSGTRIKIIEALSVGCIVISTKKGIEGIKLNKKNPPFICLKRKDIFSKILHIIENNKKIKLKANNSKYFYIKYYSMQNNVRNFIDKNLSILKYKSK